MEYVIEEPKTESGVREVPMSLEVEEAFRTIIKNRKRPKVEPMVGGMSGFLYLDKNDMQWEDVCYNDNKSSKINIYGDMRGYKKYD